ncbi:MAG TPA: adenosylhomocysteinase [Acidimicrobiia bacterium]|nr:adenosylhomocysteinase [Acidimicrobiia bacterium]HIL06617.1 adenosylhomocysteinase [Acidimicrobiia bacterium]
MSPTNRSRILNPDLAPEGHRSIEWARRHSPLVDGFLRERLKDGALEGRRVAVVVHLEAKTALLATVLADAGAQVVAAGSNPHSTRDEIAAALVERGVEVHSTRDSGYDAWEKDLLAVADTDPELIIDDGAELTIRMASQRPAAFEALKGVTEQTTTGVARLVELASRGRLPFPVLAANDAACKHLFDNKYGTGQSTVQAILNLTNMLMAGKDVAILGYGWVGRGIAAHVRALGGTAWVIEVDPVKALEAFMDGHRVGSLSDVLPRADFILTATGGRRAIARQHFSAMKNGAILANAGHHDLEIDVEALADEAHDFRAVRPGIDEYIIDDNQSVLVLANGALVNIAGGLGHPIEIMDLSFAVQGVGCHELARGTVPQGVNVIDPFLDSEIARAKLAAHGIVLDAKEPGQADIIDDLLGPEA